MKYISVQPSTDYYVWQLEVLDRSLIKNGYDLNDFTVIFCGNILTKNVIKYRDKNINRVHFIADTRKDMTYVSSIRPHALAKFCKKNLINNPVFYHDSDIAFTKFFNWDSIVKPQISMVSNTISYIGANYVDSKSPELLNKMCEIVGIEPDLVRSKQRDSGGCQYILPPEIMSYEFWNKVEKDSTDLYKLMVNTATVYNPEHPIQAFCADMWAVLWNLWLSGIDTEVHLSLNFGWSSWKADRWKDINIFHLAGVTGNDKGLFFKQDYLNRMPFGDELHTVTQRDTCNWKYCEIINELKELGNFYK